MFSFNEAAAANYVPAKVIDSYGGCTWKNNGDGTSTVQVLINYRAVDSSNIGTSATFVSRSVLFYTYDATGKVKPNKNAVQYVTMNGTRNSGAYLGDTYVRYTGNNGMSPLVGWDNKGPHTAIVEAMINNSAIRDWPAVSIFAGIFTNGFYVVDWSGAAYVSFGSAGACTVTNPEVPKPNPPPSIAIDVAAPDWNLGELPRGDDEKTLAGAEQQLCFTYTGFNDYRNFVINATSANGVLGNRYLLKNASKPSQTVPYDLTLDSGSATFRLPNASASPVQLSNNSRTCFVPTFRTSVGTNADAGDYSDVLSFTVVTKS